MLAVDLHNPFENIYFSEKYEKIRIRMSKIVLLLHRFVYQLNVVKIPLLPAIINKIFIRLLFGCQLSERTKIGQGVSLGYGGLGVVIHERAEIGKNVSIGT